MKLALLLYGLFRCADVPLFWRYAFPHGDIYVFSTFTNNPYTPRSYDKPVNTNVVFNGVNLASHWSVVDQYAYDKMINLDAQIIGRRDPWKSENKTSLRNAVRVLYQLRSLKHLFLAHDAGYTHLIVSRVDLLFTRPVSLNHLEHTLVIPDYAHFSGLNDRFIAGPKDDVLRMMDRVDVWRKTSLLSERLVAFMLNGMLNGTRFRTMHVGLTRRVRVGCGLVKAQYLVSAKTRCPMDTAEAMAALQPYHETIAQCSKVHTSQNTTSLAGTPR